MNCELAHERIVLAAYGELPDERDTNWIGIWRHVQTAARSGNSCRR